MSIEILNRLGKGFERFSPSARRERQQLQFLKEFGVVRLTSEEMRGISKTFGQELHAGLIGAKSSLSSLPSQLRLPQPESLVEGDEVLVVEIGGTNRYAGLVRVEKDKTLSIQHYQEPFKTREFASSSSFFDIATEVAKHVVSTRVPKAIGVVWSFPGTTLKTSTGVDQVSPEILPKGFIIPGIADAPVGEQLIAGLQRQGVSLPENIPYAVLNDTVGVLLAGNGKVGGVVGTGFNLAVEINGQIYNLEAGGFTGVPQTNLSRLIDSQENPGINVAEKQISGKYVGMELNAVIDALIENGLWNNVKKQSRLQAKDISSILNGDKERIQSVLPNIQDKQWNMLFTIAQTLRDRSGQIAGSIIGTLLQQLPQEFTKDPIRIPIEGSFFHKTSGYETIVMQSIRDVLGNAYKDQSIEFVPVEHGGTKGAAIAALTVLK